MEVRRRSGEVLTGTSSTVFCQGHFAQFELLLGTGAPRRAPVIPVFERTSDSGVVTGVNAVGG